jgi:hypothetical protein
MHLRFTDEIAAAIINYFLAFYCVYAGLTTKKRNN